MRIIVLILLLFSQANASAQQSVSFKIKNFGLEVEGSFDEPKGEIRFDPLNPSQAYFNVNVDATTINTGIALRDKHLKKEDYLDVKNYPLVKFISSQVVPDKKLNYWIVKGNLMLKNATKEISIVFTQKDDLLVGEFTINRRDFGVGGKSLSLADELTVSLHVKR